MDTETPDFLQLVFAPDNRSIWAATSDGKLEQYCTSTGKLLSLVNAGHRDDITAMLMHPTGALAFTGAFDRLFKLWDLSKCASGHVLRTCMPFPRTQVIMPVMRTSLLRC